MSAHARAFSRIENPTLFFLTGGVRRAVPRVHEFTALRDCALLGFKKRGRVYYLIGTYDTFPEAEAAYAAFGAYAQIHSVKSLRGVLQRIFTLPRFRQIHWGRVVSIHANALILRFPVIVPVNGNYTTRYR